MYRSVIWLVVLCSSAAFSLSCNGGDGSSRDAGGKRGGDTGADVREDEPDGGDNGKAEEGPEAGKAIPKTISIDFTYDLTGSWWRECKRVEIWVAEVPEEGRAIETTEQLVARGKILWSGPHRVEGQNCVSLPGFANGTYYWNTHVLRKNGTDYWIEDKPWQFDVAIAARHRDVFFDDFTRRDVWLVPGGKGDALWRKGAYTVHHEGGIKTVYLVRHAWTEPAGGGRLFLRVPGGKREGGSLESVDTDFHYGRYRASIKASSTRGVVHGFFFYLDDDNEIDIELLTEDLSVVHFVCQPGPGRGGAKAAYKPVRLWFNPAADYHEYGFDWRRDRVDFFIDRQKVETINVSMPKGMGRIILNNWPGVKGWGGADPPRQDALMHVNWVRYEPFAPSAGG